MLPSQIDEMLEQIPNNIAKAQEDFTRASLKFRRKYRIKLLESEQKSKELREAESEEHAKEEEEDSEIKRIQFDLWKHQKDCIIELARNKRVEMQRGLETEGSVSEHFEKQVKFLNDKINKVKESIGEKQNGN